MSTDNDKIELHDLFEKFLRANGLEWKPDGSPEVDRWADETPCTLGGELLDELAVLIQRKEVGS